MTGSGSVAFCRRSPFKARPGRHAGLPLLAQSGRAFLRIKCLKAFLALAVSFALWALM